MNETDDKIMDKFCNYISDSEDKPDLAEVMEDKEKILRIVNGLIEGNVRVSDIVENEDELCFKLNLEGYDTFVEVSCVDFFMCNDPSLENMEKSIILLSHIEEIDFTIISINTSTYVHKLTGERKEVIDVNVRCNKCGEIHTYSYDEIMRIRKCINCL